MTATTPARPTLAADVVSHILIGPLVGGMIASFGLWLVFLAIAPPLALYVTYAFAIVPAAASLATAQAVAHPVLGNAASACAGALATHVVMSHLGIAVDGPTATELTWTATWWPLAGALTAVLCRLISRSIRKPGKTAAILVATAVAVNVLWLIAMKSFM